ncbi:MAG: hypothetical protein KME42_13795 [Tildeniella nuda ZEHNDER 1965/U140]|nr:hypothetical protein [Tildeniella nuda ZEHNDER 1965/U140]
MNTQAIIRGGDRLLDHYDYVGAMAIVKANQNAYEGELLASYEDREAWARSVLECNDWSELQALPIVKQRHGLLLWAVIGQEEDRSSGFPIRFVKLAIAIPKA